jgi:hypothetical protein
MGLSAGATLALLYGISNSLASVIISMYGITSPEDRTYVDVPDKFRPGHIHQVVGSARCISCREKNIKNHRAPRCSKTKNTHCLSDVWLDISPVAQLKQSTTLRFPKFILIHGDKDTIVNPNQLDIFHDTYNNIDRACKARLDLFNLPSTINYNKILYLDTDILVKDDIQKLFELCNDDILYVLEEGSIDDNSDYWGKTLFVNENNYTDKSAFTSGILLFNNCEKIKDLFSKINEDIINRPHMFDCHDQPYIVYNAFKYNLYNNKVLKSLIVNNDSNIHSDKVIHHFPGGPGVYEHKIVSMTNFLNSFKAQYKNNVPGPNGIVNNTYEVDTTFNEETSNGDEIAYSSTANSTEHLMFLHIVHEVVLNVSVLTLSIFYHIQIYPNYNL